MPRRPPLVPFRRLLALALLAGGLLPTAQARTLEARIARVETAVATLQGVRVRLDWPAQAAEGVLSLQADSVAAPDLGYRYRDLSWRCPLQRAGARWRCEGELRGGRGQPLRLAIELDDARTAVALARGQARLALHRASSAPDDTRIDLARVPLIWAQALLAQAWPEGQLKAGTLDGQVRVHAATARPLVVEAALQVAGAGFDTPDASIAGEQLGGAFTVQYRSAPGQTGLDLAGQLRGGEFLVGSAYVALPPTPVAVRVTGSQAAGQGWQLSRLHWGDGGVLRADGRAGFDAAANLRELDLTLHSADVSALPARYLSGWLGQAGLADLAMQGGVDAGLRLAGGELAAASATLHEVSLHDPTGRFRFDGLAGALRFSADAPVAGTLRWQGGQLYGLDFAGASLPLSSSGGELRLDAPVSVPMLGGSLRFDGMTLRPPAGGEGADIRFGLAVDHLDIGRIAQALELPAFQGQLSGRIPAARYRDQLLAFDGGLTLQLFGGTVQVSSLALERPFGVAPSLTADLVLDDIDLMALTGVFDFGSISGKLDGRIGGLRLVDWTATAFDAELHTDPRHRVRQRISQRAVQNISSVGDASFVTSLQGQLIGLFKDFGYRRIGISCRLANEVCEMDGLHAAEGAHSRGGFTIVDGAGIPRLTVAGFNRRVDWPTLLERLAAASKGDVAPVVQ